jgi:endonuclease/exonuclease/phosphatase family metal-dependent hydrolase
MKLVSYNIQYGLGQDKRFDLARIAAAVKDADVIAMQEVERFWQRTGMVDQPAELSRLLPDHHLIYGANYDMDASYREGGRLMHRRRQFGNLIFSRLPIISTRNHLLPKFGTWNQRHTMQRGALETVINLPKAGPIRIYSTHFCHLCSGTRMPQVEALLAIHQRAPSEGGAWSGGHPDPNAGWTEGGLPPMPREAMLMGDFNFRPNAPEYDRMIGPLSPHYGRLMNLDGFVDSWVVAGNAEQEGKTVDDGGRIDYCFVTAGIANRIQRVWIDAEAIGSDHQPFWVEFDG